MTCKLTAKRDHTHRLARMALLTEQFDPNVTPAPRHLQDKHYFRKHGANAYYGQK